MDDFESLPEYQALVVAAAGKPERSMGDSVIPAEPPHWGSVYNMASELAGQYPNQLPLQVYLVKAEANTQGFGGLSRALRSLLELLNTQWDEIYPAADLDDPDDLYFERVNLMRELTDQSAFLDAIYRLPLVNARGIGEFSTRDVDVALGIVNESDEEKARCQEGLIRGAFAESDRQTLQEQAAALQNALDACKGIEATFSEKTGQAEVVSMERLFDKVQSCHERFNSFAQDYLSEPVVAEVQDQDQEASPQAEAIPQAATASSLLSRDDVNHSFDALLYYYQRCEPSSPVRVLTARAREFVDRPFFESIQALAPAATADLAGLLGELQRQPLASLLQDSYSRFLQGEALPQVAHPGTAASESSPPEAQSEGESTDANQTTCVGNNHTFPVIESRAEVVRILQDIESYFLTNEPASPLPLIIADIRKLVDRRFAEIVDEFSRVVIRPVEPAEQ